MQPRHRRGARPTSSRHHVPYTRAAPPIARGTTPPAEKRLRSDDSGEELDDKPSTNSVAGKAKPIENLSIQMDSIKDTTENSQNSKTLIDEPPMNYVEGKAKCVDNLNIQLKEPSSENLNVEQPKENKQMNTEKQDKSTER